MHEVNYSKRYLDYGFTLIELSIVLIIIGLIVGGILIGRDLIRAAVLHAQVSQITKYNTAINTFYLKYNGIPGDLKYSDALGFSFGTGDGAYGRGDGNGQVNLDNSNPGICDYTCEVGLTYCPGLGCLNGEVTYFWQQLSQANLIEGSFDGAQGITVKAGTTYPFLKGASDTGVVYANSNDGSGPYYYLGVKAMGPFGGVMIPSAMPVFTPIEAYSIDSKIDDGLPLTGRVFTTLTGVGATGLPIIRNTAGLTDGSSTSCTTDSNPAIARYTGTNSNMACTLAIHGQ